MTPAAFGSAARAPTTFPALDSSPRSRLRLHRRNRATRGPLRFQRLANLSPSVSICEKKGKDRARLQPRTPPRRRHRQIAEAQCTPAASDQPKPEGGCARVCKRRSTEKQNKERLDVCRLRKAVPRASPPSLSPSAEPALCGRPTTSALRFSPAPSLRRTPSPASITISSGAHQGHVCSLLTRVRERCGHCGSW